MERALKTFLAAAVLTIGVASTPKPASAGVFVSITIAPPVLPVYVQPPCPTPGYLWTPGYWAYGPMGYYWVPGVWVAPPRIGLLWTPGYWGFIGGLYSFHPGYWGPHVGFYGGVNYGFGYGGFGFIGGGWAGGVFRYNTAVVNVNTTVIHNTYVDRTVINNTVINRTSFNGPGGINAQPTPQQRAFANEQHFQPTANQMAHEQSASQDRAQFASVNHGNPGVTSMDRVGGQRFSPQARMAEQQHRIGEGIAHGQITPGQGARLEHQEQNIHRQVQADRAANGGHLTQQERQQVNHEQNRESRRISQDRHEGSEREHERR
jgi:hypothetical protein